MFDGFLGILFGRMVLKLNRGRSETRVQNIEQELQLKLLYYHAFLVRKRHD